MNSYGEWKKTNEAAEISTEPWGFEISGDVEEVIEQLQKYPKWFEVIASVMHGGAKNNQPNQAIHPELPNGAR